MGYLDNAGLSHLWGKVRAALAGKQDKLTPDESIALDGGEISVSLPTKAVTQTEYDALSEEEKQADIVYLVDEPLWTSVPLSIQEYDTADGWHVRKWADGYVELFKTVIIKIPLSSWASWGAMYSANLESVPFPFSLKQKYMENFLYANYENTEEANRITLMTAIAQGSDFPNGAYMDHTNFYLAYRPTKPTTDIKSRFNISVTGRWK